MTEPKESAEQTAQPGPTLRLKRLRCMRTEQMIEPGEHAQCPYCFGRLAEIEEGRHEAFCDYRPGVDPIHFGFPDEEARFERG